MFVKLSRPFKECLAISDHILWICRPKLPYIFIYYNIGKVVPGGNPAAPFMLSFPKYAELEARRPLVGKILSIAIR